MKKRPAWGRFLGTVRTGLDGQDDSTGHGAPQHLSHAERVLADRFDLNPYMARTVAELAGLGGGE